MNAVSIREATRADRATLVAFHRALYITYRDEILDPTLTDLYAYRDFESALTDDVDALLSNRDTVMLMANRDGRDIGYITGHMEHDPRRVLQRKGVVEDWFVLPEERKGGVGKLLMEALEKRFRDRGCTVMESMTWPFNELARKSHEALDFREIEIRYRKRL